MLVIGTLLAAISVSFAGVVRVLMLGTGSNAMLPAVNHRGRMIPRMGGPMILLTFLLVEAVLSLVVLSVPVSTVEALAGMLLETYFSDDHLGFVILVCGFFALGLLDDAAGSQEARGFRGHLEAIRAGRLTTGAIKALGGASVALVVGALWERDLLQAILSALVVVLTANMLNLLDLRPGRAGKVFFLIWVPLTLVTWSSPYLPVSAIVVAAAAAWFPLDLREKAMLGDSGSNLLGAVAGAGLALSTDTPGRIGVIALLTVLTLASERWSFTKIIERLGPLRWIDSLGRVREEI